MTRAYRVEPGTRVGTFTMLDVNEEEFPEALKPVVEPGAGGIVFFGKAGDGRFVWLDYTDEGRPAGPDALIVDSEGNSPFRVLTMRELDLDDGELVRGTVISRRVIDCAEVLFDYEPFKAQMHAGQAGPLTQDVFDALLPEAVEAHSDTAVARATRTMVYKMLGSVGIGDGEGNPGPIKILGTKAEERALERKAARSATAVEAIAEAWPDDGWSGTAAEVHELVGGAAGEHSLDAVKRALQRGPYASTEAKGKPSIWRRGRPGMN